MCLLLYIKIDHPQLVMFKCIVLHCYAYTLHVIWERTSALYLCARSHTHIHTHTHVHTYIHTYIAQSMLVSLTHLFPFCFIRQHLWCLVDGHVVTTDCQVVIVVVTKGDHQIVKLQFQFLKTMKDIVITMV